MRNVLIPVLAAICMLATGSSGYSNTQEPAWVGSQGSSSPPDYFLAPYAKIDTTTVTHLLECEVAWVGASH